MTLRIASIDFDRVDDDADATWWRAGDRASSERSGVAGVCGTWSIARGVCRVVALVRPFVLTAPSMQWRRGSCVLRPRVSNDFG